MSKLRLKLPKALALLRFSIFFFCVLRDMWFWVFGGTTSAPLYIEINLGGFKDLALVLSEFKDETCSVYFIALILVQNMKVTFI